MFYYYQMLQPDEVDYVIYHSPCSDGTGSGLVAWKYLSAKFPDRKVIYKPMPIGAPPPDDITGRNVLVCDYSYKKDVVADILTKVNKLLIIDHHKTAEKELEGVDTVNKIFDMNHSGAALTWNYFYPNTTLPLLLAYIEDRDIWKKALPGTDDFASAIHVLPHEFPVYDKYLDDMALMDLVNNTGVKYNELNDYYSNQAVGYSVPKFSKIKGKFYFVGYVNTTILKSETGNRIFTQYPLSDFSVCYSLGDKANSTAMSLRSTNDRVDVSKIATKFNFGGHRNASGMRLEYISNTIPGKTYDHGEIYKILENVYFDTLKLDDLNINIIYLHSTFYKHQLGSYFLQTKSKTQTQKFKVANFLEKEVMKNNEYKEYHMAAIWSYNPVEDTSKYTITFYKKLDVMLKNNFIQKLSDRGIIELSDKGTEINNRDKRSIKLVFSGLIKKIDL